MRDCIYVEHQYFVSTTKDSFKFVNVVTKEKQYIPFDDVECLIFENERSYFSKRMVTACMVQDIAVLFCDNKHSPVTMLTSDYGRSHRLKRLNMQISLGSKVKKRLWRKIVMGKINNQADCLELITNNQDMAKLLFLTGKQVDEGDTTNREAYAARRYFISLFGPNFKRGRYDDAVNASLNYGYALIRAMIRREIAIHGLEPSLGIHHESTENPFNLSDDLIEAFRPFVDSFVYDNIFVEDVFALELEEKKELLSILTQQCVIDEKVCALTDAIKVSVTSFVSCLDKNSAAPLKLPTFIQGGK